MFFIYGDTNPGSGGINPYEFDPVLMYKKHYENYTYLRFVAENELSSFLEKRQAEKEMDIATKKMKYWENFAKKQNRLASIILIRENVNKQWKVPEKRTPRKNSKKSIPSVFQKS